MLVTYIECNSGGGFIQNGKYNFWHIWNPNKGDYGIVGSIFAPPWSWISTTASPVAHYICQIKVSWENYRGKFFVFSPLTANHAGAKSACVELGGHLAIIPDAETQTFIQTKGAAYKSAGKWMTSNNDAYIDAVKTSDETGWEWSTTHDKFYFKTTQRGKGGALIQNGKYNYWHIYNPNVGDYGLVRSVLGPPWGWKSVTASTVAHYICQIQALEYYEGSYFIFSSQTTNHTGAKSACVGLGGHLAIIPDKQTQTFIQTKGAAYKSEGKWMTSNLYAYIDAAKTSDKTGWEWSTTHDKFYFNTNPRGRDGPFIVNGKYNNWHIYNPNIGNYGMTSSYPDANIWRWRSTNPSFDAHYICQVNVKSTSLVASKSTLNVKYGEDFVLCSSDANPGPPVSWKINSQDVSTNTSERVYQINTQPTLDGNSTSRLYLTRGLHQNSGVYTCNATSLDQSSVTIVTIEKRPRLLESKLETSTYTCIFIGETSPTIYWNANGGTVEQGILIIKNTVLNTHQVSSQITNLLIFGSTDVVSCWANNTDGSSNIISQTGFSDDPSSTVTSSPGGCPGNQLQVNWTDITKTSGNIVYNVSITNSSQTYMKTLTQTSTSDNRYSISFDNLTPRTEYIIKVNLFPKYSKKIDQMVGRTTGVKPSISSANANYTSNLNTTFCLISWVKGLEPGITGARIVVTSSLHKKAPGVPDVVTTVTHISPSGTYSYLLKTKPNRKHVITIAAKTCSEVGSYIVATGQCISQVQAPASVPSPTTVGSSASTSHIQVNKADETNGPISCYLVIGGKEGSNFYRDSYTWMEIENIIATSNSSTYCAAVLPRFIETSRQVSLSPNTTTQCKVNTSYAISCTNKLTNGIIYKFQVITITSADGVYLTQTSQPIVRTLTQLIATTTKQPINSTLEPSASSSTIIIAVVVVAVCMLIALVLAAYFYRKQRNVHLKHGRSQKLHFVSPEDAEQQDEEGAYVNLEVVQNPEWDILTGNLLKRYKDMLASNDAAFKKQFQELATATEEIKLQKTHAENPEHKKKNRYKNILPYDDTRVKLKETTENSDYINANYVDGYSQERKFIATQGPLDQTTGDFWRMVWEQECLVIVMLTNPVESGKKKCAKYWPDQGKRCTYDGYNVETVTEVDYGSYIVRTIHIEESNNEYASVLRKIQHFHYIAWPDHGVPLITSSLVQMQAIVNAAESDSKTTVPIVVHCSAGAGRTGAYIGFDILRDEMKSKDQVNVFRTVLNMRKQRMDMVQNMKQYIFLHKLITECYALGNTEVDAAELEEHILQQTKMLKEFDNLSIILPLTNSQKLAYQHSDDPGNRDVDVLPYDHSLVQVLGENEKDSLYLNASFITDYFPKETLIVTQDPVSTNVNAFWKAVADNNVNVIVMLSSVGNGETKDTCLPYWPDEVCQSQTYGLVKVTLVEIKKTPELIERELHVECGHIDLITTQIQCLFWEENLDTEGTKSLVNLVSIAGQLRKENGASLIHCCDGAGRSGVFCAVNNIIKRLRTENRIDVFRTVKDLRDMRPHMVRTADQYLTCYKSISAFQSSISTYANF